MYKRQTSSLSQFVKIVNFFLFVSDRMRVNLSIKISITVPHCLSPVTRLHLASHFLLPVNCWKMADVSETSRDRPSTVQVRTIFVLSFCEQLGIFPLGSATPVQDSSPVFSILLPRVSLKLSFLSVYSFYCLNIRTDLILFISYSHSILL